MGGKNTPRCMSCRHWERSYNFKAQGRDWGLCHFWGGRTGNGGRGGAFIDGTYGHEPRGCMTCAQHNADPKMKGQLPQSFAPKLMTEGEFA